MHSVSDSKHIETILDQLRSFYILSKNRRINKEFYLFKATSTELIALAQLAVQLNMIHFSFEIPTTHQKETSTFFDFMMEKCTLTEYSQNEAQETFKEMINIFITNDVDLDVMTTKSYALPVTANSKEIKIAVSSFFEIMLNKSVSDHVFSDIAEQMNDKQLGQIGIELSAMSDDKITLSALCPSFYSKLMLFIQSLAKKNVRLGDKIEQSLKTTILLLAEVTDNLFQKPYTLENNQKQMSLFPFNKTLANIYELIQTSVVLSTYFSDDDLFLSCIKNKNMLAWIKDKPTLIAWQFLSEIMLLIYSQERLMQTFAQLSQMGLAHHFITLYELSLQSSKESWILYANRLIRMHPFPIADASEKHAFTAAIINENQHFSSVLQGYRYHKCLGRTIILTNGHDYLAIKVKKKEEALATLEKEYAAMQHFGEQAKKGQLQSTIPTAKGIFLIPKAKIICWLTAVENALFSTLTALTSGDTEDLLSLIYTVNNDDYFTYLHDHTISSDQFSITNEKIIRDLITTLKKGIIFDQLADIFHTKEHTELRTDNGRYLVLVALLRRHHAIHLTHSSGRVDKWQEAIRYVNLRASGLADLGDHCLSETFYQKPWFQEVNQAYTAPENIINRYSATHTAADPDFKTLIHANIIAEYLFILTLVCGKRAADTLKIQPTLSKDAQKMLWTTMAKQVVDNAALMIHLLTAVSKKNATQYLFSFISIERLSRQMRYWMTAGYVTDFNQDITVYQKILSKLYDPHTKITFDISEKTCYRKRTQCIEGVGFSVNGINQDLGAFNAQNPMKEDNKIYYMVPALISLLNSLALKFRNTFEQFETSLSLNDFKRAVALIASLKSYCYPHSNWQKKCVTFCYARVFRATHQMTHLPHSHTQDFKEGLPLRSLPLSGSGITSLISDSSDKKVKTLFNNSEVPLSLSNNTLPMAL